MEIARRADRCLEQIERVPAAASVRGGGTSRWPAEAAWGRQRPTRFLPMADDEAVADEVREALAAVAVADGRPDPSCSKPSKIPPR